MTAFPGTGVVVMQAKAICGIAEAAGGEGGLWDHIPPSPWQGSLPNDFDQASSLSPVFRESFCLQCVVGFGRELMCRQ